MSKNKQKSENDNKSENFNLKSIKYGLLQQQSDFIKINDLFNNYFQKTNPNIIKNSHKSYEFSLDKLENSSFSFEIIPEEEIKNLYNICHFFNFFLIFIDIQSSESLKILESYIDRLIDCSQDNNKKSYIFGIYKDSNSIKYKDERITTILNCKGIDYEYFEINADAEEEFPKIIDYLIEDSKELLEEIDFEDIHNKYGRDKGKSCLII